MTRVLDLGPPVAAGVPFDASQRIVLADAFRRAQTGECPTVFRIGCGFLAEEDGIPLRLLGHARLLADLISRVRRTLGLNASVIQIFTSAPKVMALGGDNSDRGRRSGVRLLAALSGALRIVGLDVRIEVEESTPEREIPRIVFDRLHLPSNILDRLEACSRHNTNGADAHVYGIEHAAPSMFGDIRIETDDSTPFRITIGPRPETLFWAIRTRVAAVAAECNIAIVPTLQFVLTGCWRAWYTPWSAGDLAEPTLGNLLDRDIRWISEQYKMVTRHSPTGAGNSALTRESRALLHDAMDSHGTRNRLIDHPGLQRLAKAVATPANAASFLRSEPVVLGERLTETIRRLGP